MYIELIRNRSKEPGTSAYPDTLLFNTFMFTMIQNDLASGKYSYEKYKRTWERRLKVTFNA